MYEPGTSFVWLNYKEKHEFVIQWPYAHWFAKGVIVPTGWWGHKLTESYLRSRCRSGSSEYSYVYKLYVSWSEIPMTKDLHYSWSVVLSYKFQRIKIYISCRGNATVSKDNVDCVEMRWACRESRLQIEVSMMTLKTFNQIKSEKKETSTDVDCSKPQLCFLFFCHPPDTKLLWQSALGEMMNVFNKSVAHGYTTARWDKTNVCFYVSLRACRKHTCTDWLYGPQAAGPP